MPFSFEKRHLNSIARYIQGGLIALLGFTAALADEFSEFMNGPKMRFPNRFHYELTRWPGEQYFACDGEARTCMKGIYNQNDGRFVGVVLSEDQTTIMAHVVCYNGTCTNYDTGETSSVPFAGLPTQKRT
jgi:hypothetical protein